MEPLSVEVEQFEPDDIKESKPFSKGTMSIIELATLHGVQVIVKSLKPEHEITEPLTRQHCKSDFELELAINATLRHSNIVHLLGYVRGPALRSLIFEYCNGGVLSCKDFGLSKLPAALSVSIGIARALYYAHSLGIVHRDVKPSQIVFQSGTPKLGDWGLAKFCKANDCSSGATGTWEFVS